VLSFINKMHLHWTAATVLLAATSCKCSTAFSCCHWWLIEICGCSAVFVWLSSDDEPLMTTCVCPADTHTHTAQQLQHAHATTTTTTPHHNYNMHRQQLQRWQHNEHTHTTTTTSVISVQQFIFILVFIQFSVIFLFLFSPSSLIFHSFQFLFSSCSW